MHLLLMRHGEAVDSHHAPTDDERWLTDRGRRLVTSVGELLARMDFRYRAVYTSPLVRSVQTAEIITATKPGFDGPVKVHRALSIDEGTTAQALQPIEGADDDEALVMVSHMPKVSVLAAHVGRLAHAPSFPTGSVCMLDVNAGVGRMKWMLDPSTLELRRF